MIVDISDWVWDHIPKNIGIKPVDGDVLVRDIILQMLILIQETMVEFYLPSWKIKALSIKLYELNSSLNLACEPDEMFLTWRFLDRCLYILEQEAIKSECYEGVVNLKKLREII